MAFSIHRVRAAGVDPLCSCREDWGMNARVFNHECQIVLSIIHRYCNVLQSLTSLYNYRSSLSQVTTVTVEKCNATKYVSFHKKIKTNKGFMQNKFINLKLRQWDDLYIAMPQIDELYKAKRKCTAYMRRTSRYTKKLYNQHCRVPRRKTAR